MMKKLSATMVALLLITLTAKASRVGVYCHMATTGTEIFEDNNIRARIALAQDGAALLEVTNKTDRILFIDRGRSFSFVNGESAPMFRPQTETETHSYGIGAIDNSIRPNDIKLISGEVHSQSLTVYNQRTLPIAPHGKAVVFVWKPLPRLLRNDIILTGHNGGMFSYGSKGRFRDTDRKFSRGDSRFYQADNSPLTLAASVEYSFDEQNDNRERFSLSNFVESITIGSYKGVSKGGVLARPMQEAGPCFAFRSGKSLGSTIGELATLAATIGIVISIANASKMEEPDWKW